MQIRFAHCNDLDQLVQLRMCLFDRLVEFNKGRAVDEQLLAATRDYYARAFDTQECQTWVAEVDGRIVACGSLVVFMRPPYPGNTAGKDAYLLNMYTMLEYRQQGLARSILQQAMQYAREQGYGKVWLHATEDGQPLYASAGFATCADYMERDLGGGS